MTYPQLQGALFKAAKVGHTKLMLEFIKVGAKPFALDEEGHDAIFYAVQQNSKGTEELLEQIKQLEQLKEKVKVP